MNKEWKAGIAVQVSETKEGTKTLTYTVENEQRNDDFPVYIEKVNTYGEKLSYGEFDVCVEDLKTGEVEVVDTIITDEYGEGDSQKVPIRENVKYYLKELKHQLLLMGCLIHIL